MSKCENIQRELEAFLSNDVNEIEKIGIQHHLDECQECSKVLQKLIKLAEVLQTWEELEPPPMMYEGLMARLRETKSFRERILNYRDGKKVVFQFVKIAAIVILTLLINNMFDKSAPKASKELASINLYLKEHQGVAVQTVSADLLTQPATKIRVYQDDIVQLEFFDNHPGYIKSGMIFKGRDNRNRIRFPNALQTTKGQVIPIPQVREAVDYGLVMPSRLPYEFTLDSVRKIKDHNSLHLLYARGAESVSLFEQPSIGKEGLSPQDLSEYTVFRIPASDVELGKEGEITVLAWSKGPLSFVLIGETDLSQLMDIVRAINYADD